MSLFPTGKPHISFSEIFCWKECPYRHKLTHVDKLGTFEASPYLGFGTGVHESCEKYIETRVMDSKHAIKEIDKYWNENQEAITRYVDANGFCKYSPEREQWKQIAEDILVDVPDFLDRTFTDWKGVKAEEYLYESIQNDEMLFKGFIDAVIMSKDKKGNKEIWLLDWKTAGWGWAPKKKQDFNYQMQLLLYKYFWAEKYNIDPSQVKIGFVLLKRDGKNGNRCELVKVSGSPAKVEQAQKVVKSMLAAVRKRFFPKNYSSCRWCEFKGTDNCKGS
tara:strand:+ start:4355 stop:5182 length:828 start_codon:yes stop_codon:yes gene_type:complete